MDEPEPFGELHRPNGTVKDTSANSSYACTNLFCSGILLGIGSPLRVRDKNDADCGTLTGQAMSTSQLHTYHATRLFISRDPIFDERD